MIIKNPKIVLINEAVPEFLNIFCQFLAEFQNNNKKRC